MDRRSQSGLSLLLALALGGGACAGSVQRAHDALEAGELALAARLAARAALRGREGADALLFDVQLAEGALEDAEETLRRLDGGEEDAGERGEARAGTPDWSRRLALERAREDTGAWARTWAAAVESGAELASPDADWATRVISPVLARSAEAALVLFGALKRDARWTPEVVTSAERAVDGYLYGLVARGNPHRLRSSLAAFQDTLGRSFVLRKHAVVLALTRDAADALSALDQLAGGEVETIAALAFEFQTRGALEASLRAWEHAARSDGGRPSAWLRNAAESAYSLGEVDRARALLERSAVQAEDPAEWAAGYGTSARAGDGAWVAPTVLARSADACGDDFEAGWVGEAELIRARASMVEGRASEAARRMFTRVMEGCAVERLAGPGGVALADAGSPSLAEPLLWVAVMRRPEELDLFARYLDTAVEGPELDQAVQAVAFPFLEAPEARAVNSAVRLSETLRSRVENSSAAPLSEAARSGLGDIADAVLFARLRVRPGEFEVASHIAEILLSRGVEGAALTVLERYVDASDDPGVARVGVGRWLETRRGASDHTLIAAGWYERSAPQVDATTPVESLFGMSAAAWCYFRAAELYGAAGSGESALANVRAYLTLSDAGEAWSRLTRSAVTLNALPRAELLALTQEAVAEGVRTADVYMRMGRTAMGLDDREMAAEALSEAILIDADRVSEVVEFLQSSGANEVLVRVLRAVGETGGVRTQLALAEAYSVAARGQSERAEMSRGYAEGAYERYLAEGGSWEELNLTSLRSAGLHHLAAQAGLLAQGAVEALSVSEQNSLLLSLVEAGGPAEEIRRTLSALGETITNPTFMADRLHAEGYSAEALAVLEPQLNDPDTSPMQHLSRVRAAVGIATQSGDRDTARGLIHTHLVLPARTLGTLYAQPPARYAAAPAREELAGDLLAVASTLFFDAQFWALAMETAEEAASYQSFSPSSILPRTLLAAIRAGGGEISFDTVSRIVGVVGADASSWRIAAAALQMHERLPLAREAWLRTLALAPDDWAVRAQLGVVSCALGDMEAGFEAFERAVRDARLEGGEDAAADTAVLGAETLSAWHRADLALALLEGAGSNARVEVALASAEFREGQDARALRRLSRSGLPTADVVRTLLENGYLREGIARWQRSASAIPTRESDALYDRFHAVVLEQLPLVEAAQLAHSAIGRTRSAAAVELILAEQLANAGRIDDAIQRALPLVLELSGDERVWLAAMLSGQGGDPLAALSSAPQRYWGGESDETWLPGGLLREALLQAGAAPDLVAPLLDRPEAPWAMWNRLEQIDFTASRGEGLEALRALHAFIEAPRYMRAQPSEELIRRIRRTFAGVAGAGFGREAGELAERVAEEQDDARFLLIAAECFHAASDPRASAALASFRARMGSRSDARRWECEAHWRLQTGSAQGCISALSRWPLSAASARSWLGTWLRADLARPNDAVMNVETIRSLLRRRSDRIDAAEWAADSLHMDAAAALLPLDRYSDDQTFIETFRTLYLAGRVADAIELAERDLALTTFPIGALKTLQGSVDEQLDPEVGRALARLEARLLGRADPSGASSGSPRRDAPSLDIDRTGIDGAGFAIGEASTPRHSCANADRWQAMVSAPDVDHAQRVSEDARGRCGDASPRVDFMAAVVGALSAPHVGAAQATIPLVGVRDQDVLVGAERALDEGRPDLAARLTDHLLQQGTPHTEAWRLRAMARAQRGDAEGALADTVEWLERSAELRGDAGVQLLRALARAGVLAAADRVADALLRVPLDSERLGGIVGVARAFAQGAPEHGLEYFAVRRPWVLTDPVSAGLTVSIANLYAAAGDSASAKRLYETHLRSHPEDPLVLNNLAYGLAERGESLDEAERLARLSLALARPSAGGIDTLGWIQFQRGALEEASKTLALALRWHATEGGYGASDIRAHWHAVSEALSRASLEEDSARSARRRRRR